MSALFRSEKYIEKNREMINEKARIRHKLNRERDNAYQRKRYRLKKNPI